MSEAKVYASLRGKVMRTTDRMERVENGIGAGMPDVNYCMAGTEGWIEIKDPEEPVRPGTALFASNHQVGIEQINWFKQQHMARGTAFLFIATKKRLLLIKGSRVAALDRRINAMTVSQLEAVAAWKTVLPVPDVELWFDLRELLCTPET